MCLYFCCPQAVDSSCAIALHCSWQASSPTGLSVHLLSSKLQMDMCRMTANTKQDIQSSSEIAKHLKNTDKRRSLNSVSHRLSHEVQMAKIIISAMMMSDKLCRIGTSSGRIGPVRLFVCLSAKSLKTFCTNGFRSRSRNADYITWSVFFHQVAALVSAEVCDL